MKEGPPQIVPRIPTGDAQTMRWFRSRRGRDCGSVVGEAMGAQWPAGGRGAPALRLAAGPSLPTRIRSHREAVTCTDVRRTFSLGPLTVHGCPWRGSVSAMKKLINSVDSVVTDALRGMAAAHPHELDVDLDQHIVYRRRRKEAGKVAIISGGGSGHEPLHGGFVGTGMLDAACAGEIFTSPVPDQVVAATTAVDRGAGVLHIVKNYTGDVMNFEMAAEIVDADSGIQVASVVTNDDVAVEDSLYTAGRRGVGVTVMVEKIAGAAAEEGRPLEEVEAIAARVNAAGRSMGMALTSCTVPANGKPSFDLPDDEMEIGIGIHGEPGRHRERVAPAAEIAERLVTPVLAELTELESTGAGADEGVIAMVNGMGATPLLELYLMYGEISRLLQSAGITVARNLVGNYITSLDMAGCSLTLVRADAELLRLWDAPVSTPGLRWGV